jgi:hypothetical protein
VTRDEFKQFYEKVICVIADSLCEQNKEFSFCDNFNGLYEEYLNQETLTGFVCKESKKDQLDKHKIAACITISIVRVRLLSSNNIDNKDGEFSMSDANRLNEQLAFYSGLMLLVSSMKADNDVRKTLNTFKFPIIHYPEKADYIDSIVRTLYYSNLLSGYHIGLLANIFFLLEEYHKLKSK